jgi:hypothetical protein
MAELALPSINVWLVDVTDGRVYFRDERACLQKKTSLAPGTVKLLRRLMHGSMSRPPETNRECWSIASVRRSHVGDMLRAGIICDTSGAPLSRRERAFIGELGARGFAKDTDPLAHRHRTHLKTMRTVPTEDADLLTIGKREY